MIRHLCAADDDHTLVAIQVGNTDMWLQYRMRNERYEVFSFDDDIGLVHGGVKIAMPDNFMCCDIMCCIVNTAQVFACIGMSCVGFVQLRGTILAGFKWIKYGWQHLVIDIYQAEGFFSKGRSLGSDKCHPISNITYVIVEQIGII